MKVRESIGKPSLSADKIKDMRKDKSGDIEKLTEEDFDRRIIIMKSKPFTSIQESRIRYEPFAVHAVVLRRLSKRAIWFETPH
jgi:hypothetical protein